jgi:hypothetical protein
MTKMNQCQNSVLSKEERQSLALGEYVCKLLRIDDYIKEAAEKNNKEELDALAAIREHGSTIYYVTYTMNVSKPNAVYLASSNVITCLKDHVAAFECRFKLNKEVIESISDGIKIFKY